jgi:predicted aspartyl protease
MPDSPDRQAEMKGPPVNRLPIPVALLASALLWVPALLAPQPASAAQAPPTPAQPRAPAAAPASPVDALFEASGRGEVTGLERALADPATGAELRVLLRAALAASQLDPAAGTGPALRRLTAEGIDPALRRAALGIVTGTAFANGDYAEAARSGRLLAELLAARGQAEDAAATERTWRLAALLAGHGRPHVEGAVRAATIPARRDAVGLTRIDFTANGLMQEAVFDTGANLSVLSATTARRLGVTVLEGETPVGNGVGTTVATRIGIAARIEIGGTVLTNVAFLIIDDASLNFPQVPGGYAIPAILGLPELRALRRVKVEQAGRFTVLPPEEGPNGPANLHASGNDLFADVIVDGALLPLHLDTGANQTALSALYAAAHPDRAAALESSANRMASAGGTSASRVAIWPNAPVTLAGRRLTLPTLPITLPAEGTQARNNGVVGSDVLRRFESYTLDFGAMRLSLGEAVAVAPAPAPARQ